MSKITNAILVERLDNHTKYLGEKIDNVANTINKEIKPAIKKNTDYRVGCIAKSRFIAWSAGSGWVLALIMLLLMLGQAYAFTPPDDMNLRNYYGIYNVSFVNGTELNMSENISASYFVGNGSELTDISGSITSTDDNMYISGTTMYFNTSHIEDNLNVNSSKNATEWDSETSQGDLNVNSSAYWDSLNSPTDFTTAGTAGTTVYYGDSFNGNQGNFTDANITTLNTTSFYPTNLLNYYGSACSYGILDIEDDGDFICHAPGWTNDSTDITTSLDVDMNSNNIDYIGRLGIGGHVLGGGNLFYINSTSGTTGQIMNCQNAGYSQFTFREADSNAWRIMYAASDNSMALYSYALTGDFWTADDEFIINDNSKEINFRVESNNDINMLYINSTLDRIGIKSNTPSYALDVNGDFGVSGDVTMNSNWTNNQNYPGACSSGYAISQLDDTLTCSDDWVNAAGDTMSGPLDMGQNVIGNVSYLNASQVNASKINTSYIEGYFGSDCGAGEYMYGMNTDGSLDCRADANTGDSPWDNTSTLIYTDKEVNITGALLNVTALNATGNIGLTSGSSITDYFGSACSAGQAMTDIADDGTFTCGSAGDSPWDNTSVLIYTTLGVNTTGMLNATDINVTDDFGVLDDAHVGGDLTVTGTSEFTGETTHTADIEANSDINMQDDKYIGIEGNERIIFDTSGDIELMGGNVGIGTNSPLTELHIKTTTESANFRVEADGGGTSYKAYLVLDSDDDSLFLFRRDGDNKWALINDRESGGGDRFLFRNDTDDTVIYIEQSGDAWFVADVSALSFTDRTERSSLTEEELTTSIKNMDFSKDVCNGDSCEIDKTQYPEEWLSPYDHCLEYEQDPIYDENMTITGYEDGGCINSETRQGRDLTKVVSDLIRLNANQIKEIDLLKAELCKKDNTYKFC